MANCQSLQQADWVVIDRVPHGCGTRAYMDVFTACLERHNQPAEVTGQDKNGTYLPPSQNNTG